MNRIGPFSLYYPCLSYELNPLISMIFSLQNSSRIHLIIINPYKDSPSLYLRADCVLLSMIYLLPYCLKNIELLLAWYYALILQAYQGWRILRHYLLYYLLFLLFSLNLSSQTLIFESDTLAYFSQGLTLSTKHLFSETTDKPTLFGRDCSLLMLFTTLLSLDPQPSTLLSSSLSHILVFHKASPILN